MTHEGAWRAGVDGALPGIVMPARVAKGQAYLQEVAPDVAEDRAWHTKLENGRLFVLEDTPLEPGALLQKVYKRGIGLVRDSGLKLVSLEVLDDCDIASTNTRQPRDLRVEMRQRVLERAEHDLAVRARRRPRWIDSPIAKSSSVAP